MPSNIAPAVVFIIAAIVALPWLMNLPYREVATAVGISAILLVLVLSSQGPKRRKHRKKLSDIDDPYV